MLSPTRININSVYLFLMKEFLKHKATTFSISSFCHIEIITHTHTKRNKNKKQKQGALACLELWDTFCREFLSFSPKSGSLYFSLKAEIQTRMMYLSGALLVGGGGATQTQWITKETWGLVFCEAELQKNKPRDTKRKVWLLWQQKQANISRGD